MYFHIYIYLHACMRDERVLGMDGGDGVVLSSLLLLY